MAAQLVMHDFAVIYKRILERVEIRKLVRFIKIYVDDKNQAGSCLPYGTKFVNGRLYRPGIGWTGKFWNGQALSRQEMDDIRIEAERLAASEYSREDKERASAQVFREIANMCKPRSIKMVEDIPQNHSSGFLPILDTQMCISEGKIVYKHYSKPMSS